MAFALSLSSGCTGELKNPADLAQAEKLLFKVEEGVIKGSDVVTGELKYSHEIEGVQPNAIVNQIRIIQQTEESIVFYCEIGTRAYTILFDRLEKMFQVTQSLNLLQSNGGWVGTTLRDPSSLDNPLANAFLVSRSSVPDDLTGKQAGGALRKSDGTTKIARIYNNGMGRVVNEFIDFLVVLLKSTPSQGMPLATAPINVNAQSAPNSGGGNSAESTTINKLMLVDLKNIELQRFSQDHFAIVGDSSRSSIVTESCGETFAVVTGTNGPSRNEINIMRINTSGNAPMVERVSRVLLKSTYKILNVLCSGGLYYANIESSNGASSSIYELYPRTLEDVEGVECATELFPELNAAIETCSNNQFSARIDNVFRPNNIYQTGPNNEHLVLLSVRNGITSVAIARNMAQTWGAVPAMPVVNLVSTQNLNFIPGTNESDSSNSGQVAYAEFLQTIDRNKD